MHKNLRILKYFTHFKPIFLFYTTWKHQKNIGFLMFSGGIKKNFILQLWAQADSRTSSTWIVTAMTLSGFLVVLR